MSFEVLLMLLVYSLFSSALMSNPAISVHKISTDSADTRATGEFRKSASTAPMLAISDFNQSTYATSSYLIGSTEFTRLYDINGKLLGKLINSDFDYFVIEFIDPLKIFTGSFFRARQQVITIQTLQGQISLSNQDKTVNIYLQLYLQIPNSSLLVVIGADKIARLSSSQADLQGSV